MVDPKSPELTQIKFHYIKGTAFRTVHVDGVVGGITPTGNIHCSAYSERPPIPQIVTQSVKPDGSLGEILNREGRDGVVREIDFDAVMSKRVAVEVRDWLTRHIDILDKLEASSKKD